MKNFLSLLCVLCLSYLAGCEAHQAHRPALNEQDLVDRFITPAGEKAVAGVVFNKEGNAIAVTADGKVVPPCTLPKPDEKPSETTCHGMSNTDIYNVSQVTVLRHKGSNCMTFITIVGGYASSETYCWD